MKEFTIALWLTLALTALPMVALAASDPAGGASNPAGGVSNPIGSSAQYTVPNPLGSNSFCGLVQNLLQAAIQIGIPVAVLFIVYAGFKFVLARGSPEKLKEARTNFMWTIIGIAIFLGAWLLTSVIVNTVKALGGNQNIISCN